MDADTRRTVSDLTSETVKQALNWSDQAVAMTWDATEVRDAIAVLQDAAGSWAEAAQLTNEQAEDEGLWFVAATAPEAYLQQELRRLHAVIEGNTE